MIIFENKMSKRAMTPMSMRYENERNLRDNHPYLYRLKTYGIPAAVLGTAYQIGKHGLTPSIQSVYKHGFKRPASYVWRLTKNIGSAIANTPYVPHAAINSSKPTPIPSPESKGYKSEQQKRF